MKTSQGLITPAPFIGPKLMFSELRTAALTLVQLVRILLIPYLHVTSSSHGVCAI